ncbi:MAG: hypothetical protein M0R51_11655 [Clostridia bacterium]|jgi:hypothetical protein|nr:hypothetical protein [Clostridia bacterium]
MYRVDFNTGAGNQDNFETVEDAKQYADDVAEYTQCDICIYDDDTDELVSVRRWVGLPLDDELGLVEDPICFDKFGYYDDWEEY